MIGALITALESFILVLALSVDAFVASFAYGANKIRIPFSSVLVINGVCTTILALSLCMGTLLRPLIRPEFSRIVCFIILLILGLLKLCDSTIKNCIRRKNAPLHKRVAFSFAHLSFILHVYANPEDADADDSKTLSPREAASLAVALSLDGLAVGFGAAIAQVNALQVTAFSLAAGTLMVLAGGMLGNRIARKVSLDLSWLSGVLLIVLGALKLC